MAEIFTEQDTTVAHATFTIWLNSLITSYVSSFYDTAIHNLLGAAFLETNYYYLQELYSAQGKVYEGFMTIIPTDTSNNMLMVHDPITGVPYLYNNTNVEDIIQFDGTGKVTVFTQNVTLPLRNDQGVIVAEVYLVFEDLYGIRVPVFNLYSLAPVVLLCEGLLDVDFDTRGSGSYSIENKPVDILEKFEVTNKGKIIMTLNVPIFGDYYIPYTLRVGQTIQVPVTESSEYYFKVAKGLSDIIYKKV